MSDEHGVVASTRLIAGLTLLSRILGLARECLYGYFFGTGPLLSAFRVAFMVPNLARRLFGEGALSAAFIPVFAHAVRDGDTERAPRLAGGVLTLLTTILVSMVVVLEIALLVADALHPSQTLKLTTIMLPFMALICVAAFLGGVLNTLGRFAAPAVAPIMLNLFVITAMGAGAYCLGLSGVALIRLVCLAVVCAGVAQVGVQLLSLRRARFRPVLNRQWRRPDIRSIVQFMAPMMVGLSAVQINTMSDMLIALFLVPDGRGPAVLGYAQFLYQLPLGVFGIALATAIFPVMAARAAGGDAPGLTRTLEHGARLSFFIMLPATAGLMLIADPLVAALFQRGMFGSAGAGRVSRALWFYAIGLCAYAMQHILVRVFYSMKDSRTPARIAASVVAVNLVLNLILVFPLREAGVALATAVSATLQVVWLQRSLRGRLAPVDVRAMGRSAVNTILATVVMAACVHLIAGGGGLLGSALWPASVRVAVAVPLGCVVVAGMSRLLGATELGELLASRR